jgi:hypothetical protein
MRKYERRIEEAMSLLIALVKQYVASEPKRAQVYATLCLAVATWGARDSYDDEDAESDNILANAISEEAQA